ncbi:alpha/beta fold hydrolase [Rhodococcoides yunnanense]|uniref:alpha/beta fold hydrolase n=1 Tax=Rhodococcoides yunnanense TaxID=278209 RepID=UPI001474A6C8|nr:alpha/beta hydrolase [Rhodococcus yunnanensis]
MAAFEHKTVEADGFVIDYLEGGTGPTLVMVHGGSGLRIELDDAHFLLAQRFHVVAFEMPGWGDEPNVTTMTLEQLADTMIAAIDGIGLTEYRLLATSIGAAVSLWIAVKRPKQVVAHVLEAPGAFREGTGRTGPPDPEDINWNETKRRDRRLGPHQAALMMRLTAQDTDEDLVARMSESASPTLVLYGTRDGLFDPAYGKFYTSGLPDCRLVVFDRAAHDIKGDRPEAAVDVIGCFLRNPAAPVPALVP